MNLTNQKLNQAIKLIQESMNEEVISKIVKVAKSTPKPRANLTIELNDNEQKSYDEFYEAHKGCQKYTGAIGVNNVRIIATGTSMGWLLECECTECSEKKDISDMDSW